MKTVMEDNQLVYLLGFSPIVDDQQTVLELAEQYTLESTVVAGIRCWYKHLDAETFQGAEAEANLQDIEWLTPRVLMHEAAISAISAALPLYPARFGTLFSSTEALTERLFDWGKPLEEFFNAIRGKREWGLKLWIDSNQLDQYLLKLLDAPADHKGSGSNYLRFRKAQQQLLGKREQFLQELIEQIIKVAQSLEIATKIRPQTSVKPEESSEILGGNIALLATQNQLDDMLADLDVLLGPHSDEISMRSEVTGPWAAYSFSPSLL